MSHRRSLGVAALVALLLGWSVWRAGPSSDPPPLPGRVEDRGATGAMADPAVAQLATGEEEASFLLNPAADPLVGLVGEGLNSVDGSVQRDLRIVSAILDAWQTNFPSEGNPVGLNVEITRALTGANRLKIPFIPSDHPAINRDGELCDRWGTPLVFHQIAKHHMELRSAGPDRRIYTDDDVVWNAAEPF